MQRQDDWPLVGRAEELDLIDGLLGNPSGRGVVVAGPSGSGKTRLMREVLARQHRAGLGADVVVATRAAGSIPLGPFAALLPATPDSASATFDELRWARAALVRDPVAPARLLVVDDAHLLDPASAGLLHQVAVDRDRVVLATIRNRVPMPDAIVGLWKDGYLARLDLQALAQTEVGDLLAAALAGDVDPSTVEVLFEASRGNPMFLRELTLEARRAGVLVIEGGVWHLSGPLLVPSSIEELVRARLDPVDRQDREALVTLAFADRLSVEELADLHPRVDLADLEQRGLVAVTRDLERPQIVPAHPMYAEVLRAHAPAVTGIVVARRLTELVEARGARGAGDVLRVAQWRLLVGGQLDPDFAATAAHQAYHAGDFKLAERLARAVLENSEPLPGLRALLGRLLTERGRHAESEQVLAAIDLRDLPPDEATWVAERRADNLYYGLGRGDDAYAVLDEAMDVLGPLVNLVETQAWMRLMSIGPRAALTAVERAPDLDRPTVVITVITAWARAISGHTMDALQAAKDAATRAEAAVAGDDRHAVWAQIVLCMARAHAGALDEAEEQAVARHQSPGALPPYLQARWALTLADVLVEQGRIAQAELAYRQSAGIHRRIGQDGFLRLSLAGQALCAAQRGRWEDAGASLAELQELRDDPVHLYDSEILAAKGWADAVAGRLPIARETLAAAAEIAAGQGLVVAEARWRHDCLRIGGTAQAEALADLASRTDAVAVRVRSDHAAALDSGNAVDLRAAAAAFEGAGLRLHSAEAWTAAAAALHADDRRSATFAARRAAALVQQCGDVHTPGLHARNPVEPLTAREREVVTMAASGSSSAQIADELVLSIRTINNHLQRAYQKLGVHSRGEAADALGITRLSTNGPI